MDIRIVPKEKQICLTLQGKGNLPNQAPESSVIYMGKMHSLYWAYALHDFFVPEKEEYSIDLFTYILNNAHEEGDRLLPSFRLKTGDMLVMHSLAGGEVTDKPIGDGYEAFQFWIESDGSFFDTRNYLRIDSSDFKLTDDDGVLSRQLIGVRAPVYMTNDMCAYDVMIPPDHSYRYAIKSNRSLGVYVLRGSGSFGEDRYQAGDFIRISHTIEGYNALVWRSDAHESSRLLLLDMVVSV